MTTKKPKKRNPRLTPEERSKLAKIAAKKRNPQDSTTRNIRAANKRIKHLENQMRVVISAVAKLLKEKGRRS